MAKMYINGECREMTPEEVMLFGYEEEEATEKPTPDALTEMVEAMSTATTLAQMRSAAKNFLEKTERGETSD